MKKSSTEMMFEIVDEFGYDYKVALMKSLKELKEIIAYETYLRVRKQILPLTYFSEFEKLK